MNKGFILFLIFIFVFSLFVCEVTALGTKYGNTWGNFNYNNGRACSRGTINCDDWGHCGTRCPSGNGAICCGGGGGGGGTTCGVANCVNSSSLETADPTISVSGCVVGSEIQVNNINYPFFGVPGATLTASGFGKYNFVFDNGVTQKEMAFGGIFLDENIALNNPTTTNSSATFGTPQSSGLYKCTSSGGCTVKSTELEGIGDQNTISYNLATAGGHTYALKIANSPIANTMPSEYSSQFVNNIYVGFPSLIVSGTNDLNTGFTEKFGVYNKQIVFTLANRSPLDINLDNYELRWTGNGITGSIDKNYVGWGIDKFNGEMVIRGNLTVDKSHLPINSVFVWLDVNYTVPTLITPACNQYYLNNTSSKPISYKFGLLDKQKFQIGTKSNYDFTGCIGENGMIGETGESYVPRINIGFGGSTNSNNEIVSIDECDEKTLDDSLAIDGADNDDWVYCSQNEFLVELARKIGKTMDIRNEINIELQGNNDAGELQTLREKEAETTQFDAYIKSQNFSVQDIQSSVDRFSDDQRYSLFLSQNGLENYSIFEGQNAVANISLLKELLTNAEFTYGGYPFSVDSPISAGKYHVIITIKGGEIGFFINGELNPSVQLTIDLTPSLVQPDSFDWFFYDSPNDLFEDDIPKILSSLNSANMLKRGTLMEFNKNDEETDLSDVKMYTGFASPLFAKVVDINGYANTNFSIYYTGGEVNYYDAFTLWTGVGSTLGEGCKNISVSDEMLPYREPDTNISAGEFDLSFLGATKPNNSLYLESVLYVPQTSEMQSNANYIRINSSFGVYSLDDSCEPNQNNCFVQIDSSKTPFRVLTLSDLFNAIREESVCVNKSNTLAESNWTLFWNSSEILDSIKQTEESVVATDASSSLCTSRPYVTG